MTADYAARVVGKLWHDWDEIRATVQVGGGMPADSANESRNHPNQGDGVLRSYLQNFNAKLITAWDCGLAQSIPAVPLSPQLEVIISQSACKLSVN